MISSVARIPVLRLYWNHDSVTVSRVRMRRLTKWYTRLEVIMTSAVAEETSHVMMAGDILWRLG